MCGAGILPAVFFGVLRKEKPAGGAAALQELAEQFTPQNDASLSTFTKRYPSN
jgi:hypothetical protein